MPGLNVSYHFPPYHLPPFASRSDPPRKESLRARDQLPPIACHNLHYVPRFINLVLTEAKDYAFADALLEIGQPTGWEGGC